MSFSYTRYVHNDETVEALTWQALSLAEAGADAILTYYALEAAEWIRQRR